MQTVPVQEALGMVLRHDVTRIIPGKFKGRALKKGHIINEEDIPVLLNMGKEHVYAFDLKPGYVHEDEAAARIARAVAGNGILFTESSEGRVNLKAGVFGLLKVNTEALQRINEIEEINVMTIEGKFGVGHFEISAMEYEAAWQYMYHEWLYKGSEKPRDSFPFELYVSEPPKRLKDKSFTDIFIPIE